MVTVFFYYQGVLLLDFKEPDVNINAERYADSLKHLRVSIENKRPRKLTNGVILLHDNAWPQMIKDLLGRIDVYKRQRPSRRR